MPTLHSSNLATSRGQLHQKLPNNSFRSVDLSDTSNAYNLELGRNRPPERGCESDDDSEEDEDIGASESSIKFNKLVEIVRTEKMKSEDRFKNNHKDTVPVNRSKSRQGSCCSRDFVGLLPFERGSKTSASSRSFAYESSGRLSGDSPGTFEIDSTLFNNWQGAPPLDPPPTNHPRRCQSSNSFKTSSYPKRETTRQHSQPMAGTAASSGTHKTPPAWMGKPSASDSRERQGRPSYSRETSRSQLLQMRHFAREQSWKSASKGVAYGQELGEPSNLANSSHHRPGSYVRESSWTKNNNRQAQAHQHQDYPPEPTHQRTYSEESISIPRRIIQPRRDSEVSGLTTVASICSSSGPRPASLGKGGQITAEEEIMVEIFPGVSAPLRRAKETVKAVAANFYVPVKCIPCCSSDVIYAMADVQYFVCPTCRNVSRMEEEEEALRGLPQNHLGLHLHGLGLGFTIQTLLSMQTDIALRSSAIHHREFASPAG